jgi:heme exporter protein D
MSDDCKKYLRVPTKEIFVRVARKFGVSVLIGLVPEDDQVMQKRLKNIRKELERKARARKQGQQESDDEEDIDSQFTMARKPQT